MELISCITPTFNREELLEKAIQSTLNQTWTNWELIIVDDGSKDGTGKMVERYITLDPRIKYFHNPGKGASSARNYGILMSTGDYIVFLDDDDEHLPHRFMSQLMAMQRSGLDFVLSGFGVRDLATGKIIHTDMVRSRGTGAGHGVRWMIKRELLLKAGLFDEEMPAMQEVELSYRIARYGNYAWHNDIVVVGGVNHSSITGSKEKMIRGRKMLIEKQGVNMQPVELAWWYYILGMDYWSTGNISEARKYISLAARNDPRNIFGAGLLLLRITGHLSIKPVRRISMKIASWLAGFRFPMIVDHPSVDL